VKDGFCHEGTTQASVSFGDFKVLKGRSNVPTRARPALQRPLIRIIGSNPPQYAYKDVRRWIIVQAPHIRDLGVTRQVDEGGASLGESPMTRITAIGS